MSLVVVATALPFRAQAIPFFDIAAHWSIIVNLLAGSIAGAWFGAGWATRLKSETLYKVIAALLVAIALILVFGHGAGAGHALLNGTAQWLAGVAGGELLIPTLVLLFGTDVKLAGSLSLAVSLPTMMVGFRPLQPGPEFLRSRAQQGVRVGYDRWIRGRNLSWRTAAWAGARRHSAPGPCRYPARLCSQGLEARLIGDSGTCLRTPIAVLDGRQPEPTDDLSTALAIGASVLNDKAFGALLPDGDVEAPQFIVPHELTRTFDPIFRRFQRYICGCIPQIDNWRVLAMRVGPRLSTPCLSPDRMGRPRAFTRAAGLDRHALL